MTHMENNAVTARHFDFPFLTVSRTASTKSPQANEGLSVFSALTASTRTAERIKAIESSTARLLSVEERENMMNGLGEIRESYETGWGSGSDDDDD